jgi:hypothetical protein
LPEDFYFAGREIVGRCRRMCLPRDGQRLLPFRIVANVAGDAGLWLDVG